MHLSGWMAWDKEQEWTPKQSAFSTAEHWSITMRWGQLSHSDLYAEVIGFCHISVGFRGFWGSGWNTLGTVYKGCPTETPNKPSFLGSLESIHNCFLVYRILSPAISCHSYNALWGEVGAFGDWATQETEAWSDSVSCPDLLICMIGSSLFPPQHYVQFILYSTETIF
jgi:hypothetical protein